MIVEVQVQIDSFIQDERAIALLRGSQSVKFDDLLGRDDEADRLLCHGSTSLISSYAIFAYNMEAQDGDRVVVAFVLVSLEAQRHGWILLCWDFRCRENGPP